jgi:hypothetical protein
MKFEENIQQLNNKMFEIISVKEITYLRDLDLRININKYGKFNYYKLNEVSNNKIYTFLHELDDNKVYTLIPFISANDRPDEPYIILSQQILITHNSSILLISDYINNKIIDTINLYNVTKLEEVKINFKYKPIKIKFNENKSF